MWEGALSSHGTGLKDSSACLAGLAVRGCGAVVLSLAAALCVCVWGRGNNEVIIRRACTASCD
jgi:hypothetical protein